MLDTASNVITIKVKSPILSFLSVELFRTKLL